MVDSNFTITMGLAHDVEGSPFLGYLDFRSVKRKGQKASGSRSRLLKIPLSI